MPKDALTRRRGRRPAGFCQEQTPVMIEQFSSMECDEFHIPYLSDKISKAVFHGQAVKTVAYLRVSTAQQDVRRQRLAILEYARKHDFRIDDFIEPTASASFALIGGPRCGSEKLRRELDARRLAERAALKVRWAQERVNMALRADQRTEDIEGGYRLPAVFSGNGNPPAPRTAVDHCAAARVGGIQP